MPDFLNIYGIVVEVSSNRWDITQLMELEIWYVYFQVNYVLEVSFDLVHNFFFTKHLPLNILEIC